MPNNGDFSLLSYQLASWSLTCRMFTLDEVMLWLDITADLSLNSFSLYVLKCQAIWTHASYKSQAMLRKAGLRKAGLAWLCV